MLKRVLAKLHIALNVQPRFCKARSVHYALRHKLEAELERLQKEDVNTPVQFSNWAASTVPVLKDDGIVNYVETIG